MYLKLNMPMQKPVKILFPLVKQHFKTGLTNALLNYVNELIGLFQRTTQTMGKQQQQANVHFSIDQLLKFYDYVNSLIESLLMYDESSSKNFFLQKLKQLLKWSITNTNELLIDSISTSNSLSANSTHHSLIQLDKLIENFCH
jgi:hypothetical protein